MLILAAVFNTAGYIIVFKTIQSQIRSEIKQKILGSAPEEKFCTLAIPPGSPAFHRENSHEFTYKGSLYDIVTEKHSGSEIIFTCINDKAEERLFDALSDYVDDEISDGKSKKAKALKCFSPFSFDAVFPSAALPARYYSEIISFPDYSRAFLSITFAPEVPPPKLLV